LVRGRTGEGSCSNGGGGSQWAGQKADRGKIGLNSIVVFSFNARRWLCRWKRTETNSTTTRTFSQMRALHASLGRGNQGFPNFMRCCVVFCVCHPISTGGRGVAACPLVAHKSPPRPSSFAFPAV